MMAKKAVSQSRTMWVKKGETVGGKVVKKGYLAQYGKPEKRVSANVRMVTEQGIRTYKQGRRVNATSVKTKGAVKNPPTDTQRPKVQGYVGKPGTRKSTYQTGEGMVRKATSRVKTPPMTKASSKWSAVDARAASLRNPKPRQLRVTKPVRVAYEVGSNIPTTGYRAGRTLRQLVQRSIPSAKKTLTNLWYE